VVDSSVSFEIQLEFGAVVGISFGPLSAQARITAGIYLLCGAGGRRVLEGFVQAVGEGNIACFSVTVLIQIKTTQQNDSSMSGSSTYSFSFKVGFAEISYGFVAGYRTAGSGGQPSGSQARVSAAPTRTGAATARREERVKRKVRTKTSLKQYQWDQHRKLIDLDAA
jgi:hypothetical protein